MNTFTSFSGNIFARKPHHHYRHHRADDFRHHKPNTTFERYDEDAVVHKLILPMFVKCSLLSISKYTSP